MNRNVITFPDPDPDLAHWADHSRMFSVLEQDVGERLDRFTARSAGISRLKARALIEFGSVWVRGRVCRRQSYSLDPGDWVSVQAPVYGPVCFFEADPGRILYSDPWLLGYDKEAGIPCQQTPYDGYNNLFFALKRFVAPGYLALHHRLDRPTSGVMIFSRHKRANPALGRAFSQGSLVKDVPGRHSRPATGGYLDLRPAHRQANGAVLLPRWRRGKTGPNRVQGQSRSRRPLPGRGTARYRPDPSDTPSPGRRWLSGRGGTRCTAGPRRSG